MVEILLVIVFLSTSVGITWSCSDCSWQNSRNERKNCTIVSDQSPRPICANIFDDGSGNIKQLEDAGVKIQHITPFVYKYNTDKTSIKELALNVSFQLPVGVEKHEYVGLLIQVTFEIDTYCLYWDFFNEPLTNEDEGIILYFDCFYGVTEGIDYVFGITLLSRKSIGKEVIDTITVSDDPCFYRPCGNATCIRKEHLSYQCQCNEEGFIYNQTLNACICLPCTSLTRKQRSSNSNWKPEVQELKFTYAKATVRFSLEPHAYDCYHIILRHVKCNDDESKNCKSTKDGPSVIIFVNGNKTLSTRRFKVDINPEDPSNKVRAYFKNESEYAMEDLVVYVEIEYYFIERGHYNFLLRWYPCCHCRSYNNHIPTSVTGPEYYSDDPCFYNPCGGATCTTIKREDSLLEYECLCKEGLLYNKSANKCIYDKSCTGWCLKKTVALLTTVITMLVIILTGLLYRNYKVKISSDENVDGSEEVDRSSVTSQDFRSLEDLKKFQEKCERERECSLNSSPHVSSSSGYRMLSTSETTDSSVTHCQCFSSLTDATSL